MPFIVISCKIALFSQVDPSSPSMVSYPTDRSSNRAREEEEEEEAQKWMCPTSLELSSSYHIGYIVERCELMKKKKKKKQRYSNFSTQLLIFCIFVDRICYFFVTGDWMDDDDDVTILMTIMYYGVTSERRWRRKSERPLLENMDARFLRFLFKKI